MRNFPSLDQNKKEPAAHPAAGSLFLESAVCGLLFSAHRSNGEIWLLPENEDYDPIDGSDAVILGRVTAVVRQY